MALAIGQQRSILKIQKPPATLIFNIYIYKNSLIHMATVPLTDSKDTLKAMRKISSFCCSSSTEQSFHGKDK
jgi:hypothetical protein